MNRNSTFEPLNKHLFPPLSFLTLSILPYFIKHQFFNKMKYDLRKLLKKYLGKLEIN